MSQLLGIVISLRDTILMVTNRQEGVVGGSVWDRRRDPSSSKPERQETLLDVGNLTGKGWSLRRCLLPRQVRDRLPVKVKVVQCQDWVDCQKRVALEEASERKQGELTCEKEMKCQSPYSRLETTKVWPLSLQTSVLSFWSC